MCWACTVLIRRADGYNCSIFIKQCSVMPCTENQIPAHAAISPSVYQSRPRHSWSYLNMNCFYWCQPHAQPPVWGTSVSLFVWVITFDLSRMRDLASSCATAGLALRIFWLRKPNNYVKVGISSAGWAGVEERKSLYTHRIRTRNRPARMESLYRILSPGPRLS